MRNPAQFLEKSLEENGMIVDSVTHEQDITRQCDTFTVAKSFGGEPHHYTLNITDEEMMREDESKLLAMYAQNVAQEFEKMMVETISFGRRHIKVCPYEGGWAECSRCGARAELSENLLPQVRFVEDAELCVPKPIPRDPERFTEMLHDEAQVSLKLYLLGLLRTKCDMDCPNSRYYDDRKI